VDEAVEKKRAHLPARLADPSVASRRTEPAPGLLVALRHLRTRVGDGNTTGFRERLLGSAGRRVGQHPGALGIGGRGRRQPGALGIGGRGSGSGRGRGGHGVLLRVMGRPRSHRGTNRRFLLA
jgi:hypothetical protein